MNEETLWVNVDDLRAQAEERLDAMARAYYSGGAGAEDTLRDNEAALRELRLVQRVLVDVSRRDLSTTVLGTPVSMPVLVAPTAFQRLAHPDGELATARAAGAAGVLMTLSTLSTVSLEEVAEAAAGPLWFQLYMRKNRAFGRELVERAEVAGYRAVVLTVDLPVLGRRDREIRYGFHVPPHLSLANLAAYVDDSDLEFDPTLDWSVIGWLKGFTRLPVIVKGIQTPDDARRAVAEGADAIWVSNHGGRQLDGGAGTARLLPGVVAAVGDRAEVYVDGGIRRGTDVLKALALGARAVCVGRPVLWGLAAGGEAGVRRVLDILREELDLAMALTGCRTPVDVGPHILFNPPAGVQDTAGR